MFANENIDFTQTHYKYNYSFRGPPYRYGGGAGVFAWPFFLFFHKGDGKLYFFYLRIGCISTSLSFQGWLTRCGKLDSPRKFDVLSTVVYTTEQRTKMVELYLTTKSIVRSQRLYVSHFNTRQPPSKCLILYNVEKFRNKGTVHNLNKTIR